MTEQPTNPLVAGKFAGRPKATAADIEACAADMNMTAAAHNLPWRWTTERDEAGLLKIKRIDHRPEPRLEAKRDVMDRRGERMSPAETDELNRKLEHYGATARYRPDGSKYFINRQAA